LGFASEKIIGFGLIFLILFTPLAFGSVYVWAFSIMEIIVFSMLMILIVKKGLIQERKISFPLFSPIIVFLALILFQMMPLPPSAIKLLSPKTHELYSQTLDGYPGEMREDGGRRQIIVGTESLGGRLETGGKTLEGKKTKGYFENWRSISLYPHATRTGLLKIISYLGIFLLIINYVDSKRELVRVSTAVVYSGIFVALVGILQKLGGASKIYWFWEPFFKKDASFFGPFVNPNHFAGYMEMVIPVAIGLFIWQWRNLVRNQARGFREFFIKIGSEDGCKLILFSFLIIFMVGALFLSASRGGVISFLASMIYLLVMVVREEKAWRNILIVVVLLISTFSFLVWMGIRPLVEEFSTVRDISRDYDIQYRFQNWRDSLRLVRDFPLFGVGLDAFPSLFPKYKTSSLQYSYLYLENDYLQFLCEMGIFGFGIFSWFILSFFRELRLGHSKDEPKGISSIQYISLYGCLTGVVAIMIHSFWDFNMHIPSNVLLFSIIMGLAVAGGRIRLREYSKYPARGTS
jgi:O-antigen ligase